MTRFLVVSLAVAIGFASGPPARGETIDFEDLEIANDPNAALGEEVYADLGVHFVIPDDGATWSGLPDDPGGWGLEGSDGGTFLGFDGPSYSLTVDFDAPVVDFQLDVAAGVSPFGYLGYDQFLVAGFRNGVLVDKVTVPLGAVNDWTTVSLEGEVDHVFWVGFGIDGMRFGVDALRWVGPGSTEEEALEVACDIKPGDDANVLNPASRGVVPIAVFGGPDFDVLEIDPDSLVFGPGEAPVAHASGPHLIDLNGDGYLDLLSHHSIREAEIAPDATEACLRGMTVDEAEFAACDAIRYVPGH